MRIIFAIPNYNMRQSLGRLVSSLSAEQPVYADADLELRSTGLVQAVQDWFSNEKLGLAGSLILDRSGRPSL